MRIFLVVQIKYFIALETSLIIVNIMGISIIMKRIVF